MLLYVCGKRVEAVMGVFFVKIRIDQRLTLNSSVQFGLHFAVSSRHEKNYNCPLNKEKLFRERLCKKEPVNVHILRKKSS